MWKNKRILVTGSEGLIGKELVIQLKELGANVFRFDIKNGFDITNRHDVLNVYSKFEPEYIFHLFGIKGTPKMTKERPTDFMVPILIGDTISIFYAQHCGVKRFLYTSSIATNNLNTDKYPAWAKQTAITLIDAMRLQYPNGTKYCMVKPVNIYGKYDDFDSPNAMVITSLINMSLKGDIKLYNNGQTIRDFVNAKDCARGMIEVMEKMPEHMINISSGKGVKIKRVAEIISKYTGQKIKNVKSNEPMGNKTRILPLNWSFRPKIKLDDGIKHIIEYKQNEDKSRISTS